MDIDFSKLQQMASTELEESNKSNNNSQYKLVYPGDGKIKVKLLYNMKMSGVQRKIIRHDTGKGKVSCLQMYGEECGICGAIHSAEELLGKECGAYQKYGYKIRGICYGQITFLSDGYFKKPDDPKVGDVVLLMYPKTVYDLFNKIIVDSGEHIGGLVAENKGRVIVIDKEQQANGYPKYTVAVDPYGESISCVDDKGNPDNAAFEALLEEIPDLREDFSPRYPDEKTMTAVKALAEVINTEYMSSHVISPNNKETANPAQNPPAASSIADTAKTTTNDGAPFDGGTQTAPLDTAGKPDCFGKHSDGERKCLVCSHEVDCTIES